MTRRCVGMLVFCGLLATSGAQWWPIVRLTNTETASMPEGIAGRGDYVHVIWSDEYSPAHEGTFYARSSDDGAHWSSPVLLDSLERAHDILTSGNSSVHLFEKILGNYCYYKRSTDDGATWLPEVVLSYGYVTTPAKNLGSCLHVAFQRNDSIFVRNSSDNGASWDSAKFVVWRDQMVPASQHLAADDSSRLHLCWTDRMGGHDETFYTRSTDNGASWQSRVSLGDIGPYVVTGGQNNVYVLTSYGGPGTMIRSTDGGLTWSESMSAPWSLNTCSANGWLHGVGHDEAKGAVEVKYGRSKDLGQTWDAFDVSDLDSVNSQWPHLAVSDSLVHIVWQDFAPGNAEVYYRRGSLFMPGVLEEPRPLAKSLLVLHPQPARTVLHVEGGPTTVSDLRVYNMCGRRIENVPWECRAGVVSVALSTLRTGVYSAVLAGVRGKTSLRFVVCK